MSITAASGWLASGVRAGTKPSGELDLALVWSEHPATVAGAFTTSKVPSAHVQHCKPRVASGSARGFLVTSGIANAFTGEEGLRDAARLSRAAADVTGTPDVEMLMCATGTIGPRLPVDEMLPAVELAAKELSADGADAAAKAILTTDTKPKTAVRDVEVGGMAKGAGMIFPKMEPQGTLLVFLTTDGACDSGSLQRIVAETIPTTFNAITIDGCMSTSDTVLLFANGSAGIDVSGSDAFRDAVRDLMADLAYQVVADGEGATRVIRSVVKGAASSEDAYLGAQEIARSDLLRSAIWGNDANLGRIVQALGQAPIELDPSKVDVSMAGILLSRGGVETGKREEASGALAHGGDAIVEVDLHLGESEFEYLSCDLTPEYVKFNADYTT